MDGVTAGEKAAQQRERARTAACAREHRDWWRVIQRKSNASAFNGYRRTPSAYSGLRCTHPGCGRFWRTKAAYVDRIPDQ